MQKKFFISFSYQNKEKRGESNKNILKNFLQIFLIFKHQDCLKFDADSEYVIKNVFFCYLAANFIDLLDMQICKNMQLHKIIDSDNNSNT